jgi:hypothetical protein
MAARIMPKTSVRRTEMAETGETGDAVPGTYESEKK